MEDNLWREKKGLLTIEEEEAEPDFSESNARISPQ
jgi:hypothetical protein